MAVLTLEQLRALSIAEYYIRAIRHLYDFVITIGICAIYQP